MSCFGFPVNAVCQFRSFLTNGSFNISPSSYFVCGTKLKAGLSRHLFKEFCLSTFMSMVFFSNIKYAADFYFVFSIDILNRSLMN